MDAMKRLVLGIVLVGLCLLAVAPLQAQDPVKVAPENYKVVLDNAQMRILDVHLAPGGKTPMHSHPGYAVYSFTDSKVKFTMPDGKTAVVDIKAGETMWRNAETHSAENVGTTEVHVLNIELKAPAAATK
jgi:quercetin dioxygenase-like cupin family protein